MAPLAETRHLLERAGLPVEITLIARDGVRDVVRGGPGTDRARIDPGTDNVAGVETLLP